MAPADKPQQQPLQHLNKIIQIEAFARHKKTFTNNKE
jgi:hypothetical protein